MNFELTIAAKRDPVERAEALQREAETLTAAAPAPVAVITVNGAFSEQNAAELAQSVKNVLHKPADTVIVRFEQVVCEEPQSLVHFARWVDDLRRNGHDVRVVTGEPHVDALLADRAISPDAGMPPAEADAAAGRRVVDTQGRD